MSDMKSNDKATAAMRLKNADNLNTSGKEGVVPCSPMQAPNGTKMPTGHVEVGTGKKS
jgi:hypothetical protein